MAQKKKIVIGTRGSKLSLAQTTIVQKKLQSLLPDTLIEIKIITTHGDTDMRPIPLDSVGKGWFTKELDKSLLVGDIDLAVHSLKDLPEELPKGLIIAAIPDREDPRDVLISRNNVMFHGLPKGSSIGTDSTRRQSQLLHMRADLTVSSLRGNVLTRLKKLEENNYDAIILAAAGIKRLGLADKITEYFSLSNFLPSPGQGALAIVCKTSNKVLHKQLSSLDDASTVASVTAERAFSKAVGGSCKMPIGAFGKLEKNKLILDGVIGSPDGKHLVTGRIKGLINESETLGEKLAQQLLEKSKSWYHLLLQKRKTIVITRPENKSNIFKKRLEALGYAVYIYPTIKLSENSFDQPLPKADWIVFTSANGVKFFITYLKKHPIAPEVLQKNKFAAVGPQTAQALEKAGFHVSFIPTIYTTKALAQQLPVLKRQKILLLRSAIASEILITILQKRGAQVTNIPIYQTDFQTAYNDTFVDLISSNQIQFLTFTSPSTITGFINSIEDKKILQQVLTIPVLSIGPVTTKATRKNGFKKIITAQIHTIPGMIEKLQKQVV